MEGREHGEFKLDDVAVCWDKWYPMIPRVLREFNFIRLAALAVCTEYGRTGYLPRHSLLDRSLDW